MDTNSIATDVEMRRAQRLILQAGKLLVCDGRDLRRLTAAALAWLTTNYQTVNDLNVFPVPDGDTGTNMLLTMQSAYKEIENKDEMHVGRVAHVIAEAAKYGARGNSGVILSQIWRGFARGLGDHVQFGAELFARAMRDASDTAYRGVGEPVEGTILTVSKDVAAAAEAAAAENDDLRTILEKVVVAAHESVQRTPELLPVLKKAGVVDSGGMGFAFVLEGMLRYLQGLPLDTAPVTHIKPLDLAAVGAAMDEVEPGQDWEVVLDFRPRETLDLQNFYTHLKTVGTSIQVGEGEDVYRLHIHLPKEKRHEPIDFAESLGTVTNVHMENLLAQMDDIQSQAGAGRKVDMEEGQIVAVVVSPGSGFDRVFAGKAVSIVSGGQTMNPSTADILAAFEDLPTGRAVILPNNKNIQLAAGQAAEASKKHVRVIPTRTVPQGIAAMLAFDSDGELDPVVEAMTRRIGEVDTGEVTTATRTVEIDGVSVSEGQIIGLHNGRLACAGTTPEAVVIDLLAKMNAGERELLTLYFGNDLTRADAERAAAVVSERFAHLATEIYSGGQQHYHYIFSLE